MKISKYRHKLNAVSNYALQRMYTNYGIKSSTEGKTSLGKYDSLWLSYSILTALFIWFIFFLGDFISWILFSSSIASYHKLGL